MMCKYCKQTLILVNLVYRGRDWSTFCGIGDQRHEPEGNGEWHADDSTASLADTQRVTYVRDVNGEPSDKVCTCAQWRDAHEVSPPTRGMFRALVGQRRELIVDVMGGQAVSVTNADGSSIPVEQLDLVLQLLGGCRTWRPMPCSIQCAARY